MTRYSDPVMRKSLARAAVLAPALLLGLAETAAACPSCKEAAGGDGYQWAILLMIGGVFSIIGGVIFMIVRVSRHLDAAQEAAANTAS